MVNLLPGDTKATLTDAGSSGAVIVGPYRYLLWRRWGPGDVIVFIMLNPSTADSLVDDPTIRRCIGFAKALGAGGLQVVNLYGWRSTDPNELTDHMVSAVHPFPRIDRVGPLNDRYVLGAAQHTVDSGGMVICAWGAHKSVCIRARAVAAMLHKNGIKLHCLRVTKAGHPAHPLYLPANLLPIPFTPVA